MADNTLKLSLNQLRPNMILAEDAVNIRGMNILSKNTRLTVDAFERLRRNKVKSVTVWSDTVESSEEAFMSDKNETFRPIDPSNPIAQKEDFKKFTKEYEKKLSAFKSCLDIIKTGHYMDMGTLFSIVDGIVSVASCKSDLLSYVSYLEDLDDYTYTHSINVSILCNIFAKWLNMSDDEVKDVSIAGLLHDVGKNMIDRSIVNNELEPTNEEKNELKKHPELGCKMLEKLKMNEEINNAIFFHHERIDGSGYPYGLKDNDIPKYAKIVSICDVYDNLITKRKETPFTAIKKFREDNLSLLDTDLLLKFAKNILYIYTGTWAKLSDGRTCQVMFINDKFTDKPIVRVDNDIIDLVKNKELSIVSMI